MLLVSCRHIPENFSTATDSLDIYPSYTDVYIPYNIAPLNFIIRNEASSYLTKIASANGKSLLIKGKEVRINQHAWRKLLESNKGESLSVDIYLKQDRKWYRYPTITNHIAAEPIDPYVVFRWIQPLYTAYEDITINQRNLENFDVRCLYDNRQIAAESSGQCVNCHSFQNYNRQGNMQMHFRGDIAGTVIVYGDKHKRINTKAEGLISGAVYPSWHPTQPLIAYSVNKIGQDFHTKDIQKTEVLDTESDLILYQVDNNDITRVDTTKGYLETFPYWSPDGNQLYYSAARYNAADYLVDQYNNIHYNIVRKPFNQANKTFGEADTIMDAASIHKSATLPRISPDGNYLLFSMADYGNFHIWHKSSDLYLMNLATRSYKNLNIINSPDVDSYHAWSSNGRWIIFSSRRDDGNYTRLYIAYFDKNGEAHKPFVLPQKYPLFDKQLFKSYNIPEFIVEPANTNQYKLIKTIRSKTENSRLVR